MKLKDKVKQLKENNYDETDSDEHARWERQKKANERSKKKYLKRCKKSTIKMKHFSKDKVI